jgi:hypothetical protein
MPDYSKSVIYTIRSKDSIYVGSTVNFRARKNQHKNCMNNENLKTYNLKIYKTIRQNDGDWDMQPYSIFPCKSKMELSIEEERVRQLLKADMNSQSCGSGMTLSEYKKQHNKQYYETHYEKYRDEFNKKRRQKITCECGCVTTKGGLSIHRKSKKHILGMEKLNQ